MPGTSASTSGRIEASSSGSSVRAPVAPPVPKPGRTDSSSGRVKPSTKIGEVPCPVDQVVEEVQQPRVGVLDVLHEQDHRVGRRQPLEEDPPAGEELLLAELPPVAGERAPDSRARRVPT